MSAQRTISWTAAIVGVVAAAALTVAYLLVKRVPTDYRPLTTTPTQNRQAVDSLRNTVVDFIGVTSRIGSRDPAVAIGDQARRRRFVIGQEDMNRWVASLPPEVTAILHENYLSRPALAIGDGRLTFYAHLQTVGTVIGLDFQLVFNDDDEMVIRVQSARLGRLALPERLVAAHKGTVIYELRRQLRRITRDDTGQFGPLHISDVEHAVGLLIDALDGQPIRLDIPREYGHARIRSVELQKGQMILDIVSLLSEDEQ